MKESYDGDSPASCNSTTTPDDSAETMAATGESFAMSRRRFLEVTGATAALGPLIARATAVRRTNLQGTNTPPPRKPSTSDVFPGVRRERAWIPMKDGVHLSAELWIPVSAGPDNRVPPVLEYTPYRIDDESIDVTYIYGAYMSQHGIASVRVDIRGTGESEDTDEGDHRSLAS